MYLFSLSGEHDSLPLWEVSTLLACQPKKQDGLVLVEKIEKSKLLLLNRLAYTKFVGEVVWSAPHKKFLTVNVNWNTHINGSFAVVGKHSKFPVKEIAGKIYDALRTPVVSLKNPDIVLMVISGKRNSYIIRLLWKNNEPFSKRKPHLRPGFHPSSLSPKLARCMVNLAHTHSITDPFCGSGGILIEAGLMGVAFAGSDLDNAMVRRANKNLEYFKLTPSVLCADARRKFTKHTVIVSDLPYGRNTITQKNLLPDFLNIFMGKRLVLGVHQKEPFNFKNYRTVFSTLVRLHKSLSKRILVLERI